MTGDCIGGLDVVVDVRFDFDDASLEEAGREKQGSGSPVAMQPPCPFLNISASI